MKILELMRLGLVNRASAKTMKYFINSKDVDFLNYLESLIYTFKMIQSKRRNNAKIEVNGEEYLVNEYCFTENMNQLIATSRVYATKDAIGSNEPWSVIKEPERPDRTVKKLSNNEVNEWLDGKKEEQETEVFDVFPYGAYEEKKQANNAVRLLTPQQVERFFKLYNANQSTEDSIVTVPVKFENVCLSDFKALTFKSNNEVFIKWNESGIYDEYVAMFNGVPSPIDSKFANVYVRNDDEVMAAWLVS